MIHKKTVVSVLLTMLLLCTMALPAMALSQGIDVNRTGSLNVRILKTGSSAGVPGGKVEIYQITSVVFDPYSGYRHSVSSSYSPMLSRSEISRLKEMTAADKDALVKRLVDYIKQETISSQAQAVPDSTGKASFTGLALGLYLVVQTAPATQYSAIAPFLITIPQYNADNTEVIYAVDAAPKAGTADPVPTPPPTPAPTPAPGGLPQTGQLWWPVYAFAGLGMILFIFGWLRRREDRNA